MARPALTKKQQIKANESRTKEPVFITDSVRVKSGLFLKKYSIGEKIKISGRVQYIKSLNIVQGTTRIETEAGFVKVITRPVLDFDGHFVEDGDGNTTN